MPTMLECPACHQEIPVTEATRATKVECPFCAREFTAFSELGVPLNEDSLLKKRPKKKLRADDDDDDDDDDGDGPKKSKRGAGGAGVMVIVVGSLGLLSVMAALGLFTWLIVSYDPNEYASTRSSGKSNPAAGPTGPNTPNRPGPNRPGEPFTPNVGPDPGFNPNPNPIPKLTPKPKDTFQLRPATAPRPNIIPPQGLTTAPTVVQLPGRAGEVFVGGGGRYLVIHIPGDKKMVLFDVNQLRLVAEQKLEADADPVFAVGVNRMYVIYPGRQVMQQFALPTLQPEVGSSAPTVELQTRVLTAGMGSATNGPLFVVSEVDNWPTLYLYDTTAGRAVEGSVTRLTIPARPGEIHLRVAANGRAAAAEAGLTTVYTERFGKWHEFTKPTILLPGQDENQMFEGASHGGSMYDANGNAQDTLKVDGTGPWIVPATHDGHFVALALKRTQGKGPSEWPVYIDVYANRDVSRSRVRGLPEPLPELAGLLTFPLGPENGPLDRNVFLFPRARTLAVIPVSRDRIVLRKADLA
jgi:hypothetical protein